MKITKLIKILQNEVKRSGDQKIFYEFITEKGLLQVLETREEKIYGKDFINDFSNNFDASSDFNNNVLETALNLIKRKGAK